MGKTKNYNKKMVQKNLGTIYKKNNIVHIQGAQSNNIIITHSERALFNLNARVEARGIIVPKAVSRGYYDLERRHKGI